MKQLTILALLVGTLTYAHPTTEQEKKEVYTFIRQQLEEGKISVTTAQRLWKTYVNCCRDTNEKTHSIQDRKPS